MRGVCFEAGHFSVGRCAFRRGTFAIRITLSANHPNRVVNGSRAASSAGNE
jgi:hypothetical protein